MLNRLKLEKFKAWRKADLKFGKVTGFFGTNSSGKSSLLQLLLLLKQTKDATDRGLVLHFGGSGEYVNLGTFSDVVHRHNKEESMSWLLDWTLRGNLEIEDPLDSRASPLFEGNRLKSMCEVGWKSNRLSLLNLAYVFDDVEFALRQKSPGVDRFELVTDCHEFEFIKSRQGYLSGGIKTHLFPSRIRRNYRNAEFLGDFEQEYEDLMDSIYYLGPLREHPRRVYHWYGSRPDGVGQRGEYTIEAILAATARKETRSIETRRNWIPFQAMIARWLNELGLIREFRIKEIAANTNQYQAMVKVSSSSVPTALTDVGFGISQILPALVLLYYVREGSVVLMEQPEIHLHPAVQSGLADVILHVAETRNVQVIVESHSEHLLRRMQRRVAEEEVSFEDVKLYFVSSKRGEARASDLMLNKWGEIENWPKHFFGDEMGEIAAVAKSSLKRRMEQRG